MKLFELIDTASFTKVRVAPEELTEYVPYIANRHFSYFKDTFPSALKMNKHPLVPKEVQFYYYLNILPSRKRFYKWPKKQNSEDVNLIANFYKINLEEAKTYLTLMTEEQVEQIKRYMNKGGIK